MPDTRPTPARRIAAIAHVRHLRELDMQIGIKHSGIALDIMLLFYERQDAALCVQDVTTATGYSGPTVRLVLRRLQRAKALALASREGRTLFYALTPQGIAGFDRFVAAIYAFAETVPAIDAGPISAASARATGPDLPEGLPPPPGRREAARPDRLAAD